MLRQYEKLKSLFERTFPEINKILKPHRRLVKYFIAGSSAAATNIISLYILVHFLRVHYLLASIEAWFISFFVSFTLQKFWTFSSRSLEQAHKELVLYFSVAFTTLIANTALMYVFVEFWHVNYLVSQFIISLGLAFFTFFINKLFIFQPAHTKGKRTIIIATPTYPPDPGGPPTHAAKYKEEFERAGYVVHVVVASHMPKLPPPLIHIIYALAVFIEAVGADMIYVMDPISSGPAAYVARFLHKPYIIRIGGDVVWERAAEHGATSKSCLGFYQTEKYQNFRFFNITKSVLTHAEKVIVPCQLLKDLYIQYYAVPAERIVVIPNPLPIHLTPDPSPKGRGEEQSVVFASRLVSYKNLEFIIKAFEKVNATLYILGDGPEKAKLTQTHKVKILGTVSRAEKDEYLKKCMITIAPALTEFNPNYVLEGLAFCKPTLMSRENGLPFALPEIMLFDPRNEQEFISKLTYLLSDIGYTEAQNWVRQLSYHQTWGDVVTKNLEIIKETIEA